MIDWLTDIDDDTQLASTSWWRRWKRAVPDGLVEFEQAEPGLQRHLHDRASQFLRRFGKLRLGCLAIDPLLVSEEMDAEEVAREATRCHSRLSPIGIRKEHIEDFSLLMDEGGRVLSASYTWDLLFEGGSGTQMLHWHCGEFETPHVGDCVAALGSSIAVVRRRAAFALGQLASGDGQVLAALVNALQDSDDGVRWNAAAGLGNTVTKNDLEDREAIVLSELIEALRDAAADVRHFAGFALGRFQATARSALTTFIELLENGREDVRALAANVLGHMGPVARESLPSLRAAQYDPAETVRRAAGQALTDVEDASTIVLRLTQLGPRCVSWREIQGLGTVPEVVSALVDALVHDDETVRVNAADALPSIDAAPEVAVSPLVQTLYDESERVRLSAIRALARFGPAAKDALAVLCAMRDQPNRATARMAAEAVGRICREIP